LDMEANPEDFMTMDPFEKLLDSSCTDSDSDSDTDPPSPSPPSLAAVSNPADPSDPEEQSKVVELAKAVDQPKPKWAPKPPWHAAAPVTPPRKVADIPLSATRDPRLHKKSQEILGSKQADLSSFIQEYVAKEEQKPQTASSRPEDWKASKREDWDQDPQMEDTWQTASRKSRQGKASKEKHTASWRDKQEDWDPWRGSTWADKPAADPTQPLADEPLVTTARSGLVSLAEVPYKRRKTDPFPQDRVAAAADSGQQQKSKRQLQREQGRNRPVSKRSQWHNDYEYYKKEWSMSQKDINAHLGPCPERTPQLGPSNLAQLRPRPSDSAPPPLPPHPPPAHLYSVAHE